MTTIIEEGPPCLRYASAAALIAHDDAGRDYKAGNTRGIHAALSAYQVKPAGGDSADEIADSYRRYYRGTWNAMVSMDEAAHSVGAAAIRYGTERI